MFYTFLCSNGKIPVPGGGGGGGVGGLRCLALTSMSRRLLHRWYDMRGGEGNAAWQRCEERRIKRIQQKLARHEHHLENYPFFIRKRLVPHGLV